MMLASDASVRWSSTRSASNRPRNRRGYQLDRVGSRSQRRLAQGDPTSSQRRLDRANPRDQGTLLDDTDPRNGRGAAA